MKRLNYVVEKLYVPLKGRFYGLDLYRKIFLENSKSIVELAPTPVIGLDQLRLTRRCGAAGDV